MLKKELYNLSNYVILLICLFWFLDHEFTLSLSILLLCLTILTGDFKQKLTLLYSDKVVLSYILFIFLFIIGLFWTEDFYRAKIIFYKNGTHILAPLIILMYNKKYLKYMLFLFLTSFVIMSLISTFSYLDVFNVPIRYGGISPFTLVTFYGPSLVIIAYYFLSRANLEKGLYEKENLTSHIAFYFMVLIIILVCNRTSILALVITLFVFTFFMTKFELKRKFVYLVLNTFVIVFLMYNINDKCKDRINKTISVIFNLDLKTQVEELDSSKRSSLSCRFEFWAHSFEIINENRVIGVGTGDGYKEIVNYLGEDEHNKMFEDCGLRARYHFNPHNMYVLVVLLFGPLGLFVLLFLLYSHIKVALIYKSKALLLAVFILIFVMTSSSILFTSSYFMSFYGIFVSLIYLISKESKEDKSLLKWK